MNVGGEGGLGQQRRVGRPGGDDPGRMPALRVEGEDGQAAGRGHRVGTESRDGRANDRDFREVIAAILLRGTLSVVNTHPWGPQLSRGRGGLAR